MICICICIWLVLKYSFVHLYFDFNPNRRGLSCLAWWLNSGYDSSPSSSSATQVHKILITGQIYCTYWINFSLMLWGFGVGVGGSLHSTMSYKSGRLQRRSVVRKHSQCRNTIPPLELYIDLLSGLYGLPFPSALLDVISTHDIYDISKNANKLH